MADETKPIPRDTLDAVGRYTRFTILAELNRAFACSGLSIDQVASRIGWRPVQVRRFLSGKTKTQIEMVGETAFAIDGSLVSFSLSPSPSR